MSEFNDITKERVIRLEKLMCVLASAILHVDYAKPISSALDNTLRAMAYGHDLEDAARHKAFETME